MSDRQCLHQITFVINLVIVPYSYY